VWSDQELIDQQSTDHNENDMAKIIAADEE